MEWGVREYRRQIQSLLVAWLVLVSVKEGLSALFNGLRAMFTEGRGVSVA
jgi:hypothetical protein